MRILSFNAFHGETHFLTQKIICILSLISCDTGGDGMDQESSTEKSRIVQLSDGLTVVLHYAQDRPSLQDLMIRIMSKYYIKSAKI